MTDVSPLSVGMNPYPIPTQESCQCIPADFQFPRHLRLTGSRLQHSLNFFFFSRKFIFRVMSSHGTSQLLSGGDSACKSLTGTLGNQVTFYLCGEGKSECQYLRLYIISQLIFLFHREQDDIFQHTCIQYTHYFHQSSSQTRDLRHNQCIPFLYSFQ